jgi:DNA-binding MarR family transcriptional regulator
VIQKAGEDRRQRLLFVTERGAALALRLADLQSARMARALAELGPHRHAEARRFLIGLIDPAQRDGVLRLIEGAGRAPRRQA